MMSAWLWQNQHDRQHLAFDFLPRWSCDPSHHSISRRRHFPNEQRDKKKKREQRLFHLLRFRIVCDCTYVIKFNTTNESIDPDR